MNQSWNANIELEFRNKLFHHQPITKPQVDTWGTFFR